MEQIPVMQQADEFITFLGLAVRFRLKVEIALIVDNQVCDSVFQVNTRTEKGLAVMEYLTQAAIGARLGLDPENRGTEAPLGGTGLYFGP